MKLEILSFEKVNREARLLLTDGERMKTLKNYTENFAIDLALSRLELSNKSAQVREQAAQLLKQRDRAAEQVASVNDGLYRDLKRARAAARDAATFSLIADGLSIVGAGYGAAGAGGGQGSGGDAKAAAKDRPAVQAGSKTYELDVIFRQNGITLERYNLQQTYQPAPR
jgi:hypothetical protein